MPPPKRSLCYCESCRKLRGDEAHRRRGEPPREYALPFGWCRFNLRYVEGRIVYLLHYPLPTLGKCPERMCGRQNLLVWGMTLGSQ